MLREVVAIRTDKSVTVTCFHKNKETKSSFISLAEIKCLYTCSMSFFGVCLQCNFNILHSQNKRINLPEISFSLWYENSSNISEDTGTHFIDSNLKLKHF